MDREECILLVHDLKTGSAKDPYKAIHTLGHEGYLDAKPVIETFLHHSDPSLRYIALNVLTIHWNCKDHAKTCEAFIHGDSDLDCRRIGVAGLGALFEGTRDSRILGVLLKLFKDEKEDGSIRDSAYSQILYVLGKPATDQPTAARRLDYKSDVNWTWIREAQDLVGGGA